MPTSHRHQRYHDESDYQPRYYNPEPQRRSRSTYSDDYHDRRARPRVPTHGSYVRTSSMGSARPRRREDSRPSRASRGARKSDIAHKGLLNTDSKAAQAVTAAVAAGAVEVFKVRKDPGPWVGEKGVRVARAAIGAATVNAAVDKDPTDNAKTKMAGSTVAGIAINHLINSGKKG